MSVLIVVSVAFTACAGDETSGEAPSGTAIVIAPQRTATQPPAPKPTPPALACSTVRPQTPVFCADTAGMQAATVIAIIDGDTFDVTIDGQPERIRIFGIDTPERGDRCFAEASALLESLAGGDVRLQTDARKVDRSGRLLRYVYRTDGLSIDAVMIAAGAARAWTRDGALRDELLALEEQARVARSGCLWS